MTHRNHTHSKGARLDRIYGDEEGLKEIITAPGYLKFLLGDHVMRTFNVGAPPNKEREKKDPSLSEANLAMPEVRTLIKKMLDEQANTLVENIEQETKDMENIFQDYDNFKKIVRKKDRIQ